jgi:glycosyltransferase involved in cell wall biosynthesis
MSQTKISFLVPTLGGGGAERVMVNLANQFAINGHYVDLVTLDPTGVYRNQVSEHVNIVTLNSPRALFSIYSLVSYVKKKQPDALVSALDYMNVIALLSKLLARTKTKFIVTEHSNQSLNASYNKSIVTTVLPKFMKALYKYADSIVAVSSGVADDLIEKIGIAPDKLKVIYNPVLTKQIKQKASEKPDCEWFTTKTSPVVLSVGRLTDAKDYPTLLEAFKVVIEQIDAKLIILGEGELRDSLTELIKKLCLENHVLLKGFVENPYSYMNHADLYVLSSKWEGLSNVLIEALSLGKSIISTDCKSGPREVLADGKFGTLVPVGDSNRLAEAIIESIKHPIPLLASDELSNYLMKFTTEYVAKQYYDFIFPEVNR